MGRLFAAVVAAICLTAGPAVADGPVLTMTPDPLEFAGQPLDTTSDAQTVTLANSGADSVTLTGFSITGTDAALFDTENDTCPAVLDAATSCTVDVTFRPVATGSFEATLTVGSDAPAPLPSVALRGTGEDHSITIDVTDLAFGNQRVGAASVPKRVTLTNNQTVQRTVSAAVTGVNASDFSTQDTCAAALSPGQDCHVDVTFTPAATGGRSASLSVTADDPFQPPQAVPLTGTGVLPVAQVDVTSVPFQDQRVGTTSAARMVTISNAGTMDLSVSDVTLSGPDATSFSLTPGCDQPLPVGQSCTADVRFTPITSGPAAATLSIDSDGSTDPLTVALSGRGVEPVAEIDTSSLPFADQRVSTTSAARTVTIRNTGSLALDVSAVTLTGTGSASFSLTSDCDQPLPVGQSCTADVRFTPITSGPAAATLSIDSDGSTDPLTVALSGRGVLPDLSLTPQALAFGNQQADTISAERSVTVRNTGTHPLRVGDVTVTGADAEAFSLHGSTCDLPVQIGNTCVIQVVFKPAQPGDQQAVLRVDNDAPGGPRLVPLTGNGTLGQLSVQASSVDFGQLVDGSSSQRTFTVSNSGSAPFAVAGLTTSGRDAAAFRVSSPCTTVAAGQSCEVSVRFTASGVGERSASVQVITSVGTQTVALSGVARAATVARQMPLKKTRFAKRLPRGRWTPVVTLPVRTNAGQYATVSVTPAARVHVRQYLGKLELFVRGRAKAKIVVSLRAPATGDFGAYSKTQVYRVKAR